MADGTLLIGTRRYSSWSLRGWLAVRLAGLDVDETVIRLEGGRTEAVASATPSGTVPALFHRGQWIWDSLAIVEWCAEAAPSLWPADGGPRAHARSIAAEMHARFRALRTVMPMNLGRDRRRRAGMPSAALAADIARVAAIWAETRARYGDGGPFLFGAAFNAADAMYAPVVTRFLSYDAVPDDAAGRYCEAVRAHRLVDRWYRDADAEPDAWRIETTEALD